MSPHLRTVKTSLGATAVQIVHSSHRGSRDIEHLGSAHTAAEVELLKAAGRQKLAAGQGELDLGLQAGAPGGPLPITATRMGCLLDALAHAYDVLGFTAATGGEPGVPGPGDGADHRAGQRAGFAAVLEEAGLVAPPYRTVTRRLRTFARESWRQQISAACAAHARLGPASLVSDQAEQLTLVAHHPKIADHLCAFCDSRRTPARSRAAGPGSGSCGPARAAAPGGRCTGGWRMPW